MGPEVLSDEQRLDWLRLIRSDNVGPRGLRAHLHQPS
jgi:DNA processing protein